MENPNELTRKLNSTFASVEISNKTIGLHYSLLLNLHITHDHIAVYTDPPLKSGTGFTQHLNHHYNYKPDYKVWMNTLNT